MIASVVEESSRAVVECREDAGGRAIEEGKGSSTIADNRSQSYNEPCVFTDW
jgi:hypothetical protein